MHVPTLSIERLRLLPLGAHCDALYQRFYTDERASAAYGGPLTPGAAWMRLCADTGAWQLQGFGVWAIERRDTGELVGICGYWQGRGWPRELTWWLLPHARGQGLAQAASRVAVAHAYAAWGWDSVETYMADTNDKARALALRLGGVQVDRRAFPDGQERDVYRIPPPALAHAQR